MRSTAFLLPLLLSVSSQAAELSTARPAWLRPGEPTEVTLEGADLCIEEGENPRLWTSFPAQVEFVAGEKRDRNRATFRITPDALLRTDIVAVRAYNSQGASHPLFLWLERLPVVASENKTDQAEAQLLALPVAVAGGTADRQAVYFRVQSDPGERITIEAVAQRVGADADLVLAVRDARGREIAAADDDPVLGSDCQLSLTAPPDGRVTIAVHDLEHRGGRPFLLRVHRQPLVRAVFPLGAQLGSPSPLTVLRDGDDRTTVSAPTAVGDSSGILQLALDDGAAARVCLSTLPQQLEAEPNDAAEQANLIRLPAAVSGRFLSRGDVDRFRFDARRGQLVTVRPLTRSLLSPAVARIKLLRDDGSVLVDSRDSGAEEAAVHALIDRDGEHTLRVTDLLGDAGPELGYHLLIRTDEAPLTLTTDYNKKDPRHRRLATPGGVVVVPLKVVRHGYQGPIRLRAMPIGRGKLALPLDGAKIPAGKNDWPLRIRVPARLRAPSLQQIVVQASPAEGEATLPARLDTGPLLQQDFPQLASLPLASPRGVTLAVVPAPFEIVIAPAQVKAGGRTDHPVQVEWKGPRREPIQLIPRELPQGCKIEGLKNLDAKNSKLEFKLIAAGDAKPGAYRASLDAVGRIHGEELRIAVPLPITIQAKASDDGP